MMKKLIGIVVCMLLISTGFSISIASTCDEEPIKLRIEAEQIYNRLWIIKVFATNSFDKTVEAIWSGKRPCSVAIQYLVPNEDLKILTNHFYRRIHTFRNIDITFKPGEEKLIFSSFFFGISNWIIPGFADGLHPKYIEGFPILPEGEYEISAHITGYRALYDGFDGTYSSFEGVYLTIHYPN